MASKELKNIFLSASIPLPERDAKYFETADIVAIRDAIIALTTVVLPKHKIIWGGHPSITPLIYYVMEKLGLNIQEHVNLYQSLWFESLFPEDNNKFENIVFTDKLQDIPSSVQLMRDRMLSENKFSAAVFIGGMEGIEAEYNMFREKHPNALLLPIASTGAATRIVYDNHLPGNFKNERLLKDYGYMSLFQDLLINQI
ncbi:MAG: SLOG domain-containing protein [Flavisolibacter sp.]